MMKNQIIENDKTIMKETEEQVNGMITQVYRLKNVKIFVIPKVIYSNILILKSFFKEIKKTICMQLYKYSIQSK